MEAQLNPTSANAKPSARRARRVTLWVAEHVLFGLAAVSAIPVVTSNRDEACHPELAGYSLAFFVGSRLLALANDREGWVGVVAKSVIWTGLALAMYERVQIGY